MGILQRLSTLIRSNINDAISRGENPEKVLNQLLIDMREQLARAKQEVAVAIADERKLRAQAEAEQKEAESWKQRAILAVRESRDDLARTALMREQEHGERSARLEDTWRRQAAETEKLKAALRELNERIDEAKRKKNLLVVRHKRAQAQQRIQETMAGLNDRSAFEVFERMADKIEETERRAAAAAEVHEALHGETLEKEFARLEGQEVVEERLLALKERLGLPAPAPAAPKQLQAANIAEAGEVKDAELEEDA